MAVQLASAETPAAVFHRMALRVGRPWLRPRAGARAAGLSGAARLRDALEELGGLYSVYGQFLGWRADLVPGEYQTAMRQIRPQTAPLGREEFTRALQVGLGSKGDRLAANLEGDMPAWTAPARCGWRSAWEGAAVAVQVARPPVPDREFDQFERGVGALRERALEHALSNQALRQFRQWVRLADSVERERGYLDTIASFGRQSLVEYPRLIPELCSAQVLCWHWVEGEPLSDRLAARDAAAVRSLAEALLEQACLLSVVDADLDLAALVVKPAGGLALRRANRLVSIPPAMTRPVLKYVSAVLSGDSPYANQQLVRLALGHPSAQLESRLFDELSNLEPELKVNQRFPPAAAMFESNWRAVARMASARPLYLDMLHRNLLAVGHVDAETAPLGEERDVLAESHWPVVGKLLRVRLSDLASVGAASQWVVGSGLLLLETLRRSRHLAEGFRDDDLALHFEDGARDGSSSSANAAVGTGVMLAVLLTVFLLCLRWEPQMPAPWSGVLTAVAVLAAVALLWKLHRIG